MRHFILIGALLTLMISACIPSSQRVYSSGSTLNRTGPTTAQPPMPNAKPGSCYAKAMAPDNHITETTSLSIYTGDTSDTDTNVESRTIILSPYSQKWVKKKANGNCQSKNPDDCLVWCLVEVPQVEETVDVVIDTTLTADYEIKEFTKIIEYNEGETIWTEVVCESNLRPVLDQVSTRLVELMYLPAPTDSKDEVLSALKSYQLENRVPSGSLNFETLDLLGISY